MHRPILHIHDVHCNTDAEFFHRKLSYTLLCQMFPWIIAGVENYTWYLLIITSLTLFVLIKIKVEIINQHEALKCEAFYSYLNSLNINQKYHLNYEFGCPLTKNCQGGWLFNFLTNWKFLSQRFNMVLNSKLFDFAESVMGTSRV